MAAVSRAAIVRTAAAALGLALAGLALASCGAPEPGPGPLEPAPPCTELSWDGADRRPDLVLVLGDTMRRDRFGIYGGPARTPHFDRLGREHLLFERAYSAAPWTKPSIASLFTGLHPSQHGVLSHPELRSGSTGELVTDVLSERLTTLAEVLAAAGYETAAFVGNPWLSPEFGFAQGFEHFDDRFAANDVPGTVVVDAALAWIDGRRDDDRPYFLYVHTMDAHAPYLPLSEADVRRVADALPHEAPLSPGARATLRRALRLEDGRPLAALGVPPSQGLLVRAYDLGIEAFDASLGRLLDGLSARGTEPALIVTSDHGEALFERGWGSHGHALLEIDLGVPLAARLPGVAADDPVTCPVAGIDLMASLCRYLGATCPDHDFGVPFLDPVGGAPRWIVGEGVLGKPEHRSLRNRDWTLLREPEGRVVATAVPEPWGLHDRTQDPEERANLLQRGAGGPDVREVRAEMQRAVPAFDAPGGARAEVDAETRKRLEALGYMDAP